MKDLIEALTIFLKYGDHRNPTHCAHDELMIVGIGKDEVSLEDQARLEKLGFLWSNGRWMSFRFGSA